MTHIQQPSLQGNLSLLHPYTGTSLLILLAVLSSVDLTLKFSDEWAVTAATLLLKLALVTVPPVLWDPGHTATAMLTKIEDWYHATLESESRRVQVEQQSSQSLTSRLVQAPRDPQVHGVSSNLSFSDKKHSVSVAHYSNTSNHQEQICMHM